MTAMHMNLSSIDYERITRLIHTLSMNFKKGSYELQHLLSEYFGYHSSIFWKVDQNGNLSNPINHRISDDFVENYVGFFQNQDYLHPKKQLHLFPKEIALRLEDVTQLKDYEASDYYKEFMKKHKYYHEMVITFHSRNQFNGVLGIAKSKSQGAFSEKDRTIFRTLAPIISNLLHLETEYEEQRKEKEMLEAFADNNHTGLILLDQHYQVIYMNKSALRMSKEASIDKDLDRFIESLFFRSANRHAGSMKMHLHDYRIKVITHHEPFLAKESCYAVIIEEDKPNMLLEENQLTKREQEICSYLKKGWTYKQISEKLYISVHTVNKHIKNIYQKLGINSRAALQAGTQGQVR
ncbi:LuxR C-terminal-related transcriptional regulator [Niallia oryzisoli]|uniref:LuxR C-terminal-related transcriptional regulator n=1 Tax=Niallia oryzisoli TaxID=1737571 RepID=A0ABZ2CCQ0_9BACI